ncbi:MAG: TlpA disulfide reductase family protein [Flavobacteriales bacterium]
MRSLRSTLLVPALVFMALYLAACGAGPSSSGSGPHTGQWHMELDLNGRVLPFHFDLVRALDSTWVVNIHNGEEEIVATAVELLADSFRLRMPLFDSEFIGRFANDSIIRGVWINYLKGPDYRIPFVARAGDRPRFSAAHGPNTDLSGTWETHFSARTEDAYPATGLFQQQPNGKVTGTFLTETGDYRFLEGVVEGDSLKLSCFDGSHAFLFLARLDQDSLHGRFWSGTHWEEPWMAFRNPHHELRDPNSLTFLREGYDMVDFTFPDLDGHPVSPNDPVYKNKPVMIQVMGSWCPNCVDESRLLKEVYAKHHGQGLELISIAFEQHTDTAKAIAGLRRYRETLGLEHAILYGGLSGKGRTSEQLPFLNHVMSFPTCIFVDRNGKVRRIHTGFYGPGTGKYYTAYCSDLNAFVEQLLQEPSGKALVAKK